MVNQNKFYTLETEQKRKFYQVPKQFMHKDSKYFGMKAETKLVYGVLSDRNSLSIENGWYDDKGRIFFLFNQKDLSDKLGITPKTLRKRLEELEEYGLLFRDRSGGTLADFLYLLQLDYENLSKEKIESGGSKKVKVLTRIKNRKYKAKLNEKSVNNSVENEEKSVNNSVESVENTMMGNFYPSCSVKITHHDGEILPTNNTKRNNTKRNNTNNNNNNKTTTTKDYNNIQKPSIEKDSSSSSSKELNLNLKNVTRTNIKRLRLKAKELDLLESYVSKSSYDNIDKFTYYIAQQISKGAITESDLRTSGSKSECGKFNAKVSSFRQKNYDYDRLEDELIENNNDWTI